jgi:YidC/Oxa1 family membrane protein insertase
VNPLQLLEDPLRGLLDFLHENAHLSYGWSIVVLTVIVRTAMLPLVIKQYSSMRSMQMVAPQLKELQRKYKGNRTKLNEELMAFYKENEINPFASCLPLVAQLPVFIALYYVLKSFAKDASVSGGSVSFMWLVDDVRVDFRTIGWGAFVLVAIYGLSQLLSMELSAMPNQPESQRRLMRLMPIGIMIFAFVISVPAGLVLYWMTTNLWTCGQQLVMRHRIGLHLADPAEVARFNQNMAKKGSKTPSKAEQAAGVVAEEDVEPASSTPRKRRLGLRRGEEEPVAPEPVEAGEAVDAPEAAEAPEPEDAPESEPIEAPEPEPVATEPARGASGASGNGRSGGSRRQPRPKGAAKGSRPAPSSRSKKKKR